MLSLMIAQKTSKQTLTNGVYKHVLYRLPSPYSLPLPYPYHLRNHGQSTIMKIRTLYIPLKEVSAIKPESFRYNGLGRNLRKVSAYQCRKACGRQTAIYNETEVTAQADEFWTRLEKRLINFALKYNPSYVVRRSTVATRGDDLSDIRHDLMMNVKRLFKAYAKRQWKWVSTYAVNVNTTYLAYHRAVAGGAVDYHDGANVAHRGNFIAPRERTVFGKRKAS